MDSLSSDTMHSPGTYSSTSKSSSKSSLAQVDEDFTKDNDMHLSPLLQTELNETETSPSPLTLMLIEVAHIYEHYENPLFSTSIQDIAVIDKLKAGDHSLKNRLNPELARLISVLNSNAALRPMVENIVLKMKEDYIPHETKPANPSLDFLLSMEHFRDMMIKQTQGTAASLWAERVKTRKLEDSNADLIKKIQECTKTIEEETEAFNKTMNIKSKIISDLEGALESHNVNSKYFQKKKIHYSDCQMVIQSKEHSVNLELLKEDDAQTMESYEMVLRDNMLSEKHKRAQRFKFEVQLMSWLSKYDTDMMDKQIELDDFIKNHEEECKKIEKLEVELAEIDKEYLPLMQEREYEYQNELTEKMNQFKIEHAARVLQFAWKTVLANRIEKRKLQKEVKKLKEEEEKRQRIADKLAAQAAAAARREAQKDKKPKKK